MTLYLLTGINIHQKPSVDFSVKFNMSNLITKYTKLQKIMKKVNKINKNVLTMLIKKFPPKSVPYYMDMYQLNDKEYYTRTTLWNCPYDSQEIKQFFINLYKHNNVEIEKKNDIAYVTVVAPLDKFIIEIHNYSNPIYLGNNPSSIYDGLLYRLKRQKKFIPEIIKAISTLSMNTAIDIIKIEFSYNDEDFLQDKHYTIYIETAIEEKRTIHIPKEYNKRTKDLELFTKIHDYPQNTFKQTTDFIFV